jgi:hypothetical protein
MSLIKRYSPEIGPGFSAIQAGQSSLTGLLTGGTQVTTLSAAQIFALNATPITVTPVPGSGKFIIIEGITVELVLTATAFASGGNLRFQYHGQTTEIMAQTIAAASVTAGAGTYIFNLQPVATAGGSVITSAVAVELTNLTGAFTTGTGTGKVFCWYRIISL